MPLPSPGRTEWPPKSLDKAYASYRTNSAWYGGDPQVLRGLYGATSGGLDLADKRYRASQFQGGAVGAVARWFWGTPPPAGELLTKMHLPIASDIATMSADLLFSEPPKVRAEDKKTQERLDKLTEKGALQARLLGGAEVCAALGDVYLVVTWDKSLRDHPWIRAVHGDAVVPEWRGDVLAAATIWTVVREVDGCVWRHLERHEMAGDKSVILHGLYRGTGTELGDRFALGEVESLSHLPEMVPTGIDRLLVEHVPNMLPNRLDRTSLLGRSDYSPGVLSFMDQLDETWSSLSREIRLAKARAVVTSDALESRGPGQGSVAQVDREVFAPLNIPPGQQAADPFKLLQPDIRVEAHLATCRALTEEIIRSCGYSIHSFGLGAAEVAATATEIQDRARLSFLTRGKKALYWGAALAASLQTLLKVDQVVFGSDVDPSEPPTVDFGDQTAESDAQTATTLNLLTQAQAISIQAKVDYLHPDWDDTAKAEEVERIKDEQGMNVPDPVAAMHDPTDVVPADGPDANANPEQAGNGVG